MKDLGLQEIQGNLVKSAQPMVQLFDCVLKVQMEKKMLQPFVILHVIADAITFLGHGSWVCCSKSNPATAYLFGDKLPKHIKDNGEVNKIAKKTVVSSNFVKCSSDYKGNGNNNFKYSQHGLKPFLG